ncbi:serine protease [Methylobacterium aerolatum]|uniref:S1-C subfamily serine protease n=1 Tax=Methylobacterium aerolatum TaxID=418708 RepID=A0ABU0I730_9HYPH|nr:serine protease [Methylobacterium aerolatum]MDQ0449833.1 S1-C subfamily serine protease [Methylobacterium aerolatum]
MALAATPAYAAPKPPAFYPAEDYFNSSLDLRERVIAQVLLIGAGQQNAVPTERFTLHTFNAIREFQITNGLVPSGSMNKATSDRLFAVARPMFNMWDFRQIAHPERGRQIWIPQGMGLRSYPNKNGLSYKDAQGRFRVSYNYFPGVSAEFVYSDTLERMKRDGTHVHYSVIKDGWFVVSATSATGEDRYLRYHQDGSGILGFVAFWDNSAGVVSGERIAVLMSASLGSVMNGRPFVEPPGFMEETPARVASVPDTLPLNRPDPGTIPPAPKVLAPPPTPAAPPPVAQSKPEDKISTGSGFFVDAQGRFITNSHVVEKCDTVVVKTPDGQIRKAGIKATDAANDLALLQVTGGAGHKFAPLRLSARLGEGIATFGYPHLDMLANTGNFTLGNVTALAGINDDSRFYQISAPVQSGNSGGPVLDSFGNVTGVVQSKLNVLKVAIASGDFPQNINFAIKGAILASFLESNGVSVSPGTTVGAKLDPADLADAAKAVSGLVACQ